MLLFKNNRKKRSSVASFYACLICTLFVTFLSLAYAAFNDELDISGPVVRVTPLSDIRITKISINDFKNGALSIGESHDKENINALINLPNENSEITYDIIITNFGNIEQGIYDIRGLNENLEFSIGEIKIKEDMICDSTDRCINGARKKITLTIKYKDGKYDSNNTEFNLDLNFEFRFFHEVTYDDQVKEYLQSPVYPTYVMDGCTLTVNFRDIGVGLIKVYEGSLNLKPDLDYTYNAGTITKTDVKSNIAFNYLSKAYLNSKGTRSFYKDDSYRNSIENVEFVHYINTDHSVAEFDLSDNHDGSIIGWLELNENDNYDLYIGSTTSIYAKDDDIKESFYQMEALKTIEFNNLLDTSEATDLSYMFYELPELLQIDVSNFNTSNVTNMEAMFNVSGNEYHDGITTTKGNNDSRDFMRKAVITGIEVFDTSKVTDMEWMFAGIANTTLDVSNFDVSNVKSLMRVFSNCWNIESLDLSNWNTENNTSLWGTFNHMHNLKTIDISGFDTRNVTTIRGLFADNASLETIKMGNNFDTSNVTIMYSVFSDCPLLKSIDVSNWNTSNVTTMQEMFKNDASITELNLSSFNTSKVTSMSNMFAGMSSIKELDLSNFNTSKVTNMNNMFGYFKYRYSSGFISSTPTSLEKLDISSFNTSNVTDMDGMFQGCTSLKSLDVSHFVTTKVQKMSNMFAGLKNLEQLNLSSFNTANATTMQNMFGTVTETAGNNEIYHLDNLTTIDVSNFDVSKVTSMTNMFVGLTNVKKIDISNFNPINVVNIKTMFTNLDNLEELYMRNFNSIKATDVSSMFAGLYSLRILDISNMNTSNVTNMSYMFAGLESLEELYFDGINTSKVDNMSYMFGVYTDTTPEKNKHFTAISNLDLSSLNTSNVKNMSYMFSGLINVSSIDISNFVFDNVNSMGFMFSTNTPGVATGFEEVIGLDNRTFEKVTSFEGLFNYCTNMRNVSLNNITAPKLISLKAMCGNNPELINVEIKNWNLPTFVGGGFSGTTGMFGGSDNIVKIDMSGFNAPQMTSISGFFSNKLNLKELDLSNAILPKVTNMSGVFKGSSSLEILNLENFDTSAATNMTGMFQGCSNLKALNLSSFNTSQVTNMSSMFRGCTSLTSIDVGSFDTRKVSTMSNMFDSIDSTTSMNLETIIGLDNFDYSSATNISYMLARNAKIKSITLGDINGLVLTSMGGLFYNSSALEDVVIKNVNIPVLSNSSNFTNIFTGCNNLKTVDISGLNAPLLTSLAALLQNKYYLTDVNFSNSVLPKVTNISNLFNGDRSLVNVNLDNFDTSAVSNFSYVFQGCISLERLDVSDFDTRNVNNMANMFYSGNSTSMMSLKEIIGLENFDTSKVTNVGNTFKNCPDLTATFNLFSGVLTTYSSIFGNTSTSENALFTLNYNDTSAPFVNKITIANGNHINKVHITS